MDSAILQPSDCGDCDIFGQDFGTAVALDGNTAVVGASHNESQSGGRNTGAVWVYERNPGGNWVTAAKLTASDSTPEAFFGWSVAIQSDTAVIGAMGQSTITSYQGAVYIFHRDANGVWTETTKLSAGDANFQQYFGVDVDIDGDTVVVGARNLGAADKIGAAYVFVRDVHGYWMQQAKLTGADVVGDGPPFYASSHFGFSVDIDGDTVIVGHPLGDGGAIHSGATYVFVRDSGGTWRQQAKLTVPLSPNADDLDRDWFGSSVAIDGDTAIVGASAYGQATTGSAFVFARDFGGFWHLLQQLTNTNYSYNDRFGASVAIEPDQIIVSAPNNGCVREAGGCVYQGTVHSYGRDGNGVWNEQSVLVSHGGNLGNIWAGLGHSVAVSGGRVLAGAPGFSVLPTTPTGAAYIFDSDDLAPIVSSVTLNPSPVAAGQVFTVTATLNDSGTGNSAISSAYYTLDAGALLAMSAADGGFNQSIENVTANASGLSVGVYRVCVGGMDASANGAVEGCIFQPVYDPTGGFVTGGGWIYSAPGACRSQECAGAEGKANFGFVSRYKKGATIPTGNTEFQFSASGLNFHSETYDWLVVNMNNSNAQYKGSGTINGNLGPAGGAYQFMLWARDYGKTGTDTFRIKIWYVDAGSEVVVYDNGFDQMIEGGNILVQSQ